MILLGSVKLSFFTIKFIFNDFVKINLLILILIYLKDELTYLLLQQSIVIDLK